MCQRPLQTLYKNRVEGLELTPRPLGSGIPVVAVVRDPSRSFGTEIDNSLEPSAAFWCFTPLSAILVHVWPVFSRLWTRVPELAVRHVIL